MADGRQMADMNPAPHGSGDRALTPDPVIEAYKRDVDRTLLREQLRRTIDERVQRMIAALRLATELRAAGSREPR
jgi:hypothetical protein